MFTADSEGSSQMGCRRSRHLLCCRSVVWMYGEEGAASILMFQCSCEAPGMRGGRRQREDPAESLFATSIAFTPRGHGDEQSQQMRQLPYSLTVSTNDTEQCQPFRPHVLPVSQSHDGFLQLCGRRVGSRSRRTDRTRRRQVCGRARRRLQKRARNDGRSTSDLSSEQEVR